MEGVKHMAYKILIADDERMLTELLSRHLRDCGYLTYPVNSGKEMLDQVHIQPDLILLDINMPDMNGMELCRILRDQVTCPILFLTARIAEEDRIQGLMIGGDDYITKPFSLDELTARIGAHLRREGRQRRKDCVYASGKLLVNLDSRTVTYDRVPVSMSRREFDVIELLLTHAGQVLEREQIYERVWGLEAQGDNLVIREHIRKIRAKLMEVSGIDYIETVWGIGYRWKE